jgi:plasmid replication initiation protein
MQEWKTDHNLLYLACEQLVIAVRQPEREWCTRARQPMKELCTRVIHLLIEDLCIGIRQLQLWVRHLPLESHALYQIKFPSHKWIPIRRVRTTRWFLRSTVAGDCHRIKLQWVKPAVKSKTWFSNINLNSRINITIYKSPGVATQTNRLVKNFTKA